MYYFGVVLFAIIISPGEAEFIIKSDQFKQQPVLPVLYAEDNVACFMEICTSITSSFCPIPAAGYCPPDNLTDHTQRDGQKRSLERSKALIRTRIWWQPWHSITILILFVIITILLFYLSVCVEYMDPNLISLSELTDLTLPYDGSFGFAIILHYRMGTRLKFEDEKVRICKKENEDQAPLTDLTGWHDHSDTDSDVAEKIAAEAKKKKKAKIREDAKRGIIWVAKKPEPLGHANFESYDTRLRDYLKLRQRFKDEKKQMKRALLEHDVALGRRIRAGIQLMAKHNKIALEKKLVDLEIRIRRVRARKAYRAQLTAKAIKAQQLARASKASNASRSRK